MQSQIQSRPERSLAVEPEFTRIGDDKIIRSATWLDADGEGQERHQVLTIRDGKIADIQGCSSRREAERFARRSGRG